MSRIKSITRRYFQKAWEVTDKRMVFLSSELSLQWRLETFLELAPLGYEVRVVTDNGTVRAITKVEKDLWSFEYGGEEEFMSSSRLADSLAWHWASPNA